MGKTTTIIVDDEVYQHWNQQGRKPKLTPWFNDRYKSEFIREKTTPCHTCKCCGQEIDQMRFNEPYTSQDAINQRHNYCMSCLIFNHPRLMGGNASIVAEICVKCGQKT